MKRVHYDDWVIEVDPCSDFDFGDGFTALAYIPKTNGIKTNIVRLECYAWQGIKTQKAMLEYTQRILNAL